MAPASPASDVRDLVLLGRDHPGFRDASYRERRNAIAAIALSYVEGQPVPEAPYTEDEHAVWRQIVGLLEPVHARRACREIRAMQALFPLDHLGIPQLRDVNPALQAHTGFRMEPVMGLVKARTFVEHLSKRVFLSTQYIRHHSRPLYTPEPDVVHELIGHAASLAHPGIASANEWMGRAALLANDSEMTRLESVYWYVLEFGLVREGREVKAVGAGLLSSAGELEGIATGPALLDWDLDAIAVTPYDPTCMQPHLIVAPSFDGLLTDLIEWVRRGRWRDAAPRTISIPTLPALTR